MKKISYRPYGTRVPHCLLLFLLAVTGLWAQQPLHLTTDLLMDTEKVWERGYLSSATLDDVAACNQRAKRTDTAVPYQVAYIRSRSPRFGWELPAGTQQTAYQILVASSAEKLAEGKADVWDSGRTEGALCTGIRCDGEELAPSHIYCWTVRIWNERQEASPYAAPRRFLTADTLDGAFPRLPLCKTDEQPVSLTDGPVVVADFGKAAYAQLRLCVSSDGDDTLTVWLGEALSDGRVDRHPGGTIRHTQYQLPVHRGTDTYRLTFRPDGRNAVIKGEGHDVRPVLMPDYIGEVYPFRYCEMEARQGARVESLVREAVHYPWNDEASSFRCSDDTLNAVWDLCKYTIRMTSFCGVYVDGDRERIPYEADAFINQLSHYGTDREYAMARYTVDYLCHNGTWPTEWILQTLILAWNDYLYTGDTSLIERDYATLKARTLTALTQPNGLISTRLDGLTPELMQSCGYYGGQIRDIVDWPQSGAFGLGKEAPGEADGYDFQDYNTVVNAFHYRALVLMGRIAEAVGEAQDAADFVQRAARHKDAFNHWLYDAKAGCYRDGIGTDHHALHASMVPLAFGMVPERDRAKVLAHIQSRGMACSVYGAQLLLDALYEAGADDYALQLMSSNGLRSWYNMIRVGSTVTLEAWDKQFKDNLDWNHAWGAAPANIIPRRLMGVEPLTPGWGTLRIKPQLGTLAWAEATVPTIRGAVHLSVRQDEGCYTIDADIPAGCQAEVWLPCTGRKPQLLLDGQAVRYSRSGQHAKAVVCGGSHTIMRVER